jgi:hypothetical protein
MSLDKSDREQLRMKAAFSRIIRLSFVSGAGARAGLFGLFMVS